MENGYSNPVNGDSTANDHNAHLQVASSADLNHRRSPSSSFLSRLPFLGSQPENPPPLEENEPLHHGAHQHDGAITAIRQHKTGRKRKGSLRKTALLSTGRLKFERRSSVTEHEQPLKSPPDSRELSHPETADLEMDYPSPPTSSSTWALPPPNQPLKIDTLAQQEQAPPQDHQLLSPESITSPTSRYASTTDDDGDGGIHLNITSAADLTRRRSTLRGTPVVASPARGTPPPPAHSYSETEWWGWIILLTTWIVFVVGMGSCLGVWSWAWDVGETPYAPPELEDDPTLPIVGYYPALIVMTAVMAWVWVVVAWVGMKYFRHARFEIGDGEES